MNETRVQQEMIKDKPDQTGGGWGPSVVQETTTYNASGIGCTPAISIGKPSSARAIRRSTSFTQTMRMKWTIGNFFVAVVSQITVNEVELLPRVLAGENIDSGWDALFEEFEANLSQHQKS